MRVCNSFLGGKAGCAATRPVQEAGPGRQMGWLPYSAAQRRRQITSKLWITDLNRQMSLPPQDYSLSCKGRSAARRRAGLRPKYERSPRGELRAANSGKSRSQYRKHGGVCPSAQEGPRRLLPFGSRLLLARFGFNISRMELGLHWKLAATTLTAMRSQQGSRKRWRTRRRWQQSRCSHGQRAATWQQHSVVSGTGAAGRGHGHPCL